MGDERMYDGDAADVRRRVSGSSGSEPYATSSTQPVSVPPPPRRASARLLRTAYVYDDGAIVYADARGEKEQQQQRAAGDVDDDAVGVQDGSIASPTRNPYDAVVAAAEAQRRLLSRNADDNKKSGDVTAAKPAPRLGDAGPLALMAFGSTTILFCSHVAGTSAMNTVTISMLLFYGGLTQLICGILELINRNTFAFSAFCTYGAFWLHLAGGELLPRDGTLTGSTLGYEGGHAIVWFVISATFCSCSLKQPLVTVAVFATLALFFVIFAIGNFADLPNVRKAAGYEGMVCGSLAIYLSASLLLRDAYGGRAILPIFHHRGWRITAL